MVQSFTRLDAINSRPGNRIGQNRLQAKRQSQAPEEVGREGLWRAVVATYAAAFPLPHLCRPGPLFGKVVQEGHPKSTEGRLRRLHNHAAFAFPADHRWRAVEKHLREVHGVEVARPGSDLLVCALVCA